jgi:long-chain acyl-CoA synthetase
MIAEFGAWKLGAIVAPLNPLYTEQELEGALRENGVETIVTLTRFYGRVKRAQPRTPLARVIVTNIKEYFPPLLRLLFTVAREKREGDRITLEPGDHDLARILLEHRGRPFEADGTTITPCS